MVLKTGHQFVKSYVSQLAAKTYFLHILINNRKGIIKWIKGMHVIKYNLTGFDY